MRKIDDPFAPTSQPMPDCMMPDGTEPCAGFRVENERHNQERELNNSLHAEIERLRKENFALASGMCHDGYGDEGGSWRCKYQDEIERLSAALHALKKET